MFPAIVILSCLHLDKALLHKRSGLSSKPEVIGGQRGWGGGAEGRELRQGPAPKSLNSDVSYQLHPYGDAQRQMKRDRHWLALYFSCGDISFVVFLTEPAFIPALRWDKDLVDKSMSIPVGTLKNCRCHVHNKGKETTTYSNYIFKVSGFKLS